MRTHELAGTVWSPGTRLLAFYLPQFHPTPENNQWWGRGFTEWTNVTRAGPLFRGHYQPHLPADLGFYDLRVPEVRLAQAELAAVHGLDGFCYWHYWFNGRRLLDRPFNEVLASGEPRFPFCLAWANETWSRRWLGEESEILMRQTYCLEDDLTHARWLVGAFSDPRYVRISGRPLFLVYRPKDLPDPSRTTETFRSECIRHGLPEPYLIGVDAHCPNVDCRTIGFDSTLVFEPALGALPDYMSDELKLSKLRRNLKRRVADARLKIYDYVTARQIMAGRTHDFPVHPSVFAGWDNTPRRGRNGIVITNSTPERFRTALVKALADVAEWPTDERVVIINAWNEWAEGNHLEPDRKYGRGYLEAVKAAKATVSPFEGAL